MAAQNTDAKQAYSLISLYEKCYAARYGVTPKINRFREKWGYIDMIADLGYEDARKVIEYYFKTDKTAHPVTFLFQNYDKINQFREEKLRDEENRAKLRAETEKRVSGDS